MRGTLLREQPWGLLSTAAAPQWAPLELSLRWT